MIPVIYRFVIVALIFITPFYSLAQNNFKSEGDLKKQAELYFEEENYASAFPLYSQLLSLYPKDANYNYRFGVCMLYTSENKEKPLVYLEYASKKPDVEKEVFYHLAHAYHLNYRFMDAIGKFNEYKKVASSKTLKKFDVERQIQMCQNGTSLLKSLTDLVVIDKKEQDAKEYFRAYDLSSMDGKLLVKPDEFKTSLDKKNKEESIIFMSSRNEELFYASYGKDGASGKDIYKVKKLPNGEWSEPQNLGTAINTKYDEDYPYLHTDGRTLYFCSKGHNSMGGYDVFKTILNPQTGIWSSPVNLDFAISTPDDDFLYVPDSTNSFAYFTSKRNSSHGYCTVYKLKVERTPVEIALIKGKFISEVNGSSIAKITVKNSSGDIVGVFTSEKNGDYLINLPNGGDFTFEVESEGSPTRSMAVTVPVQYELRPLRQEIVNHADKLDIKNYFDDVMMDQSAYEAAILFIKQKASLDVNYDATQEAGQPEAKNDVKINNESTDNQESKEVSSNNKSEEFSNDKLVQMAYQDAQDTREEATELKEDANNAIFVAERKKEQSAEKRNEANALAVSAGTETNPVTKQEQELTIKKLNSTADILAKESAAASNLASALQAESSKKNKEADESLKYAQELEAAVKSGSKESLAKLSEQKKQLEGNDNDSLTLNVAEARIAEKNKQLASAETSIKDLNKEIQEIEEEQANLKAEADKTKDKQLKDALTMQAEELNTDLQQKRNNREKDLQTIQQIAKEKEALQQEADMVSGILEEIKSGVVKDVVVSEPVVAENNNTSQTDITEDQAEVTQDNADSVESNETVKKDDFYYQTELAGLSSINEPKKRAEAETALFNDWLYQINSDIEVKKDELESTKDRKRKNELKDEIKSLEKQRSEKEILAQQSALNLKAEMQDDSTLAESTNEDDIKANDYSNKSTDIVLEDSKKKSVEIETKYTEQITELEKVPNEQSKAESKTIIYDQWAGNLEAEQNQLKKKLKTESDPDSKKLLESRILELDNQILEKQTQASMSLAKSQRLKKQQENLGDNTSVTENNDVTSAPSDITSKTSNQSSDQPENKGTNEQQELAQTNLITINNKYSADLISTDTITRLQERNAARKNIIHDWEKAILQEKQSGTSSDGIDSTLAMLNARKSQLDTESTVSENELVTSEQPVVEKKSVEEINESYETELEKVNTIADTLKKEQAVASVNDKAAAQMGEQIKLREQELSKETSVERKQELNEDITELKEEQLEKETQASLSFARAERIKKQNESKSTDVAISDSQENGNAIELADNGKVENSSDASIDETESPASNNEDIVSTNRTSQNTIYSNQSAEELNLKAKQGFEKASQLSEEASVLRSGVASASDNDVKADMIRQASEKDKAALETRIESYNMSSAASNRQYNDNVSTLKELKEVNARSDNDKAVMAVMMSDEADYYFKQSQDIRNTISSSASSVSKEGALQRAYEYENLALEKQQKAKQYFTEANPGYVIQNKYTGESGQSIPESPVKSGDTTQVVKNDVAVNNSQIQEQNSSKGNSEQLVVESNEASAETTHTAQNNNAENNSQRQSQETDTNENVSDNNVLVNNQQDNNVNATNQTEPSDSPNETGLNEVAQTDTVPQKTNEYGLTEEQFQKVKYKQEFKSYVALNKEASRLEVTALKEKALSDSLNVSARQHEEKSAEYKRFAEETNDADIKQQNQQLAESEQNQARIARQESDSIATLAQNTMATYESKKREADLMLESFKEPASTNVVARTSDPVTIQESPVNNNTPENTQSSNSNVNVENNQTDLTQTNNTTSDGSETEDFISETNELKREIFIAFQNTSLNRAAIKIDERMPKGIVFKVQVGAFRNPVKPELFNRFAPVNGESSPNGITRYTAGWFKTFNSADGAKNQIRGMGYTDAFVVAFCNGKRIGVAQARELVNSGSDCESGAPGLVAISPVNNNNTGSPENGSEQNAATSTSNGNNIQETATTAQPVENIKGLFYTVQVGVFSAGASTPSFNFSPVFSEATNNGYVRYSSGKYNDLNKAKEAKAKIVTMGVPDAFVTAYFNGKRIAVSQAVSISQSNPSALSRETSEVQTGANSNASTNNSTGENQTNDAPVVASNPDGISFKVQIGAFKEEVPVEIASLFLKISSRGITHYTNAEGLTIYTVGSLASYEEANKLKEEVIAVGLKDAFVVAHNQQGEKIPLEQVLPK